MQGLMDCIAGGIRNSIENPAVPLTDERVLDYLGGNLATDSGVSVTGEKVLGLPAVWRAGNVIANDVGRIGIQVMRRQDDDTKVPAKDHAAYGLLRRIANRALFLSPMMFRKMLQLHAIYRGNGYAWIVREGRRRGAPPAALVPLPPTPITTPMMADGELWYSTTVNDQQVAIRAEDVIHIRFCPYGDLESLDVLSVMANAFGLEIAQHTHAEKHFSRGTNSVGFLTAPSRVQPEELEKIRSNWRRMQTGLDKMHDISVLSGGMTFQPLSVDPQKAQLLESRKFGLVEIANIFLLPPHKLGETTRTSFASLEQENADYLQTTIDPWFVTWEQELWAKLLSQAEQEADEIVIEYNRKETLRVDFAARVAGYARLKETGNITGNQIAAAENMPPQGPKGDRIYIPLNWTAVDEQGLPTGSPQ